jgi:hypothetical protein
MTKFNIGDTAYRAHAGQEQIWITCPECLGSGRLHVIMGDDSEVSIHCVCCERGYEGSPGKIQTYKFMGEARVGIITAVEMREGKLKYSLSGWSEYNGNIFATREEALERSKTLVLEHDAEEIKRLGYKEKQNKTWAWNVTYHRREIREAQRRIEYHTGKLNVAPKNRKDQKEADKKEPSCQDSTFV